MRLLTLLAAFVCVAAFRAAGQPQEETNAALIRKFYAEAWNSDNAAFADEVFTYPYLRHDGSEVVNNDPDTISQAMIAREVRKMYNNFSLVPDMIIAQGDLVAARWTMKGTPTGKAGLFALGRPLRITGVNIFRIQDGKVVEVWNNRDDLALVKQAGILRMQQLISLLIGMGIMGLIWFITSRVRKNKREKGQVLHEAHEPATIA